MDLKWGQSDYIAFLDECGDHSLSKIDADFPLFVLSLVLVKRSDYVQTILPEINSLKLRYWDHEGVNLHSRDIRKAEGPFRILQNATRRAQFMHELSSLMESFCYELFVVGINKQRLRNQYVRADNPYDLALKLLLERVVYCMEQKRQTDLPLVAEARGKNEDNALKAVFYELTLRGTEFVNRDRFGKRGFSLQFHDKRRNIVGIQLADLCAHPSARHILNPDRPNKAYDIVRKHIYVGGSGVRGWKVFP